MKKLTFWQWNDAVVLPGQFNSSFHASSSFHLQRLIRYSCSNGSKIIDKKPCWYMMIKCLRLVFWHRQRPTTSAFIGIGNRLHNLSADSPPAQSRSGVEECADATAADPDVCNFFKAQDLMRRLVICPLPIWEKKKKKKPRDEHP